MEKKGKLTKLEQEGIRDAFQKEIGLRKLIETASLVAQSIEHQKELIVKEIKERLNIKADPIHVNWVTGEIKWNE